VTWWVAAGPVHETGDAAGGRCGKRVMWQVLCGKRVVWRDVAGSVRETGDGAGRCGFRA